ncbi:hypothetical protein [Bosea sp. UNC402CLCol]|uniref:hypothetical protein n=1 Tax=Bosea sp. UNC402CLCol TaxID=1510531 RepID=UPI00056DF761|nr:hypothetical protein [Bosea sp. UNC402CLCol]
MISLANGIELPKVFDGLRRIQTSVVDTNVLAALYSNASPQWLNVGEEWKMVPDPSGDALIVLFDQAGQAKPLRKFRIQSAWVVFAVRPQGGWLVGRTSRRIGTEDVRDTTIYDAEGEAIHLLNGGGAIAFIQVSKDGSFWIGHDDEDRSDGAKLGGITYFAASGAELFHHNWTGPDHVDGMPMWCCYALNVIEGSGWAQYYDSMLIRRFEADGSARSWMTENNGATALAVKDGIVARIGRYDENRYRISVFRLLEPPNSEFIGRLEFDIEGERPKYLNSVDGKGDTFHIVHDDKWYRLTWREMLAHLPASQ